MQTYFLIGLIFYLFLFVINFRYFEGATPIAILRGAVFGIVFWPLAFIVFIKDFFDV
jgi:hypothetical protein